MRILKRGACISGTGSAVPSNVVTNEDLAKSCPTDATWVEEVLGIKSRRHLHPSETLLDLCISSAKASLLNSNMTIDNIDTIIVATSTPDYLNPSMASLLHGALDARSTTAAFDIQAVCSGFLYGLGVAAKLLDDDVSNVLLVGADQFSKITDFTNRNSVFFGDGAGAAVISRSSNPLSFIAVDLYTNSQNWEGFHTPRLESKFVMTGKLVKEKAVTVLPDAIKKLALDLGFGVDEITAIFPHQPSKPVLDALELALNLKPGVLKRNLEFRGNTAGATVPLLLDESRETTPIPNGSLIGFAAVGSGWTWGAALTYWIEDVANDQ